MLKEIFSKNGWKVFFIVYILNLLENILLLVLFSVTITKNTIIGAGVFSIAVTLLIDKTILKKI